MCQAHAGVILLARLYLLLQAAALSQCQQLQWMFVNRSNAKWGEGNSLPWSPVPWLWDTAKCCARFGRPAMDLATEDVTGALENGSVAVALMCSEDSIELADGRHVDLAIVGPWHLVAAARPGCVSFSCVWLRCSATAHRCPTLLEGYLFGVLDRACPGRSRTMWSVLRACLSYRGLYCSCWHLWRRRLAQRHPNA
jgi:hypothetical protein